MDVSIAIEKLLALAQPTRLAAFRHLIQSHPNEIPAGEIARFCGVPHNTLSSHLAILLRAGLIAVRRDGRMLHYRSDLEGFRALLEFLMRDCCNGRAEICAPLIAELSCCVPAKQTELSNG